MKIYDKIDILDNSRLTYIKNYLMRIELLKLIRSHENKSNNDIHKLHK